MPDLPPTVAYAAGYIETHGTDDTSPERHLWLAVLTQAGEDLTSPNEQIHQDAASFFLEDDLLDVMDMAGISLDLAPAVRERALAICQRSGRRRGVAYRGEVRTIKEWAAVTGLTVDTIAGRLRHNWTVEQTLTTPGRQQTTTD